MTRRGKIVVAKMAVVLATLPVLLWAYEFGPDPGYAGVPGENSGATCATSGCHLGTANNPANKGSVAVSFPNGAIYTPGVSQTLTVTISDPAQNAAGFELTPRIAATPSSMAGSLAATDANTQLVCSQPNLAVFQQVANTSPQSCPSGYTLQYIEQSLAGFNNSVGHLPYSFSFTWTPPCSNVGNIALYLAAVAGSGLPASEDSDHIYATTYTLSPSSAANTPQIACGGVVTASAFGGFTAAAAGSWIEIYGSNLGPSTGYQWQGSDFTGNSAPTKLQGVTVTINGQSAFVDYVSAAQVNAQVPNGVGTGPATLIISNSNGVSAPYTLTLNPLEPGLLAPSSFTAGGNQYVVAFNSDGSYTLPTGAIAGLTSRPARPGETITIYGVGFGPAAANGTTIAPGVVVTQLNSLSNAMQMFFGGTQATLTYQGLAPSAVGLYQFNVIVPPSLANSNAVPLTFSVGGATGGQTLYTAVHN
jgi:uncharacterized protein (TIGR03437 family)